MSEIKGGFKFSGNNNSNNNQRPTITIPQKSLTESLFIGAPGASPGGGMTFNVSNLFSDNFSDNEFRSFSDLLAGAMALPPEPAVSPLFAVSPGLSPSAFFNSPTFLCPSLSPYGMSHQQAFSQVTAHSALISQPHLSIQAEFHPSSSDQPPNAPRRPQNFPAAVDKPADDGYNWRKYGQKQVKGSEYPRSYYKCTKPNCPVKKKVERSFDGHITEIIYKGQHNHEPPAQPGRRGKDTSGSLTDQWSSGGLGRDYDSAQATSMQLHGPSDSEESGENYRVEEDDDEDDEPNAKRRNVGAGTSDVPVTHKTMTEPKIVVQTRSEIDLLDDGYRWRKYGQKVVKGNPNPRSYYKCTWVGCKVRKHVERASMDRRAVITTYEGKHNHDVPAARGSNMNTANVETQQRTLSNSFGEMDFGNKYQIPIALRLKEEDQFVV